MSYVENKESYQLWEETLKKWEQLFQQDSGDMHKNLQLRLECDGIWFSMMKMSNPSINKQIETVVEQLRESLGRMDE